MFQWVIKKRRKTRMGAQTVSGQRIFGRTMDLLSRVLDYRARNHAVIASNLSNIDTPGYKPKVLHFEEELARAAGKIAPPLRRTNRKHLPGPQPVGFGPGASPEVVETDGPPGTLDLDREMSKMAQNNILYETAVKLLAKKFEALKTVIDDRRR